MGTMRSFCSVLGLVALLAINPTLAQFPEDDEVLTGFPGYTHPIYSGYLDVSVFFNPKQVHYVYFESQRDRTRDPIIVWFAGGPGCSGMLSMLQEQGPFLISPGTQRIALNPNAWNKQAGLVYFELPAGVGFSTSSRDDRIDDQSAVLEAETVLRLFLLRHSSLKKSEIYFAGSGYGANYATRLARMIIDSNNDPAAIYNDKVNIKGLLLGNPCINPDECFASGSERNSFYHYEFLYTRGFYPLSVFSQFMGQCALIVDPYQCYQQRQKLDKYFNATNTSAYNIYNPCYRKGNTINLGCEDETGPITYLNDPDFKRNWNIRDPDTAKWEPCNQTVWNNYVGGNGSYHLLPGLIKDGMRLWVYSGDMDSTVPIIGTKKWLHTLKMEQQIPIRRNWREWWVPGRHKGEDQVGGFIWELEGLTFVSVKGAGFKAAQDQPVAMGEVVTGFLEGKTLPFKS